MIIPKNHLMYRSGDLMQQICQPLFDMLPVSHFEYDRFYSDGGTITLLNSEPELLRKYYELELFPNIDVIKKSVAQPAFISKSTLPRMMVDEDKRWIENIQLAEHYQIHNRFFIVKEQAEYYETFGFVVNLPDLEAMDFCMRNLTLLYNFTDHFKNKARDLLSKIQKNKINISESRHSILDPAVLPPLQEKAAEFASFLASQSILIGGKSLTSREKQCLELISKGYTMKTSAQKLELSPRTVESYLRNLKNKLNVSSIQELVNLWHLHFSSHKPT